MMWTSYYLLVDFFQAGPFIGQVVEEKKKQDPDWFLEGRYFYSRGYLSSSLLH